MTQLSDDQPSHTDRNIVIAIIIILVIASLFAALFLGFVFIPR